MKTPFTPPHAFLSFQTAVRISLAMVFTIVISNKTKAQTFTTLTATNAVVSNTLTSGSVLNAQCINAQDTIHAMSNITVDQNLDVQGNLNLNGNLIAPITSTATLGSLITNGSTIFNNSVTISAFTGTGNAQVFVDAQGNLFKQVPDPTAPPNYYCFPGAPAWSLGGNNLVNQIIPFVTQFNIGTCDAADFILKSNNTERQYIKPDGSITFGTSVPSNSGTREYKFNNGPLRLQGMSNYGGPQIVFDGGQYPYGDWGLEYTQATTTIGGLNFWKPVNSPNSFNNLFFIADNGHIGVGTGSLPARFNVDAWSGDGVFIKTTSTNNKAIRTVNANSNSENFVVYGDGSMQAGKNIQIGFNSSVIQDPNTSININNPALGGIKFNSNSTTTKLISVVNSNFTSSPFTVFADGRTRIGGEQATNVPYMLTVNGKVGAREVLVSLQSTWPDYVFAKNYKLMPLEKVENYVNANEHLPGIPSAKELSSNDFSLNLAEMQSKQMEKIEDIYLYLIEMKKEIDLLKKENQTLKKIINK